MNSTSASPRPIPLPERKSYHYNVIYNRATSKYSKTDDTRLATSVVGHFKSLANGWGYGSSFDPDVDIHQDANDLYDEHFTVVNKSMFTVVIFTREFCNNQWQAYRQLSAFNTILRNPQSNICELIPILVGIDEPEMPLNLGFSRYVSFTDTDWRTDTTEWEKVHQMMKIEETEPVVAHPANEPVVAHPANETVVAHPANEPVVVHPANEPVVVHPANEPVVVHPEDLPSMNPTDGPLGPRLSHEESASPDQNGFLEIDGPPGFPGSSIDSPTTEDIKKTHTDMVNRLAKYFYPKARYWKDFQTSVSAYLDPSDCEGSVHDIIANLLMKNHIKYGQYDKLYDIVHSMDVRASSIIKEAETEIHTTRERARSSGLFGDTTSTDIAKPGSTDEETCPKQVISVADTAASASAVPNLAMALDQQATGNGPITDRMGTGSGQSDDENDSTTEGTPLPLETDTANSTARSSGLFGDTTSTDITKPGSTDEETCPKQVISVANTAASASAVPNLAMELDQQATGNGPITDRMGTGSGQSDDENESTTEGTPLPLETDTANSTARSSGLFGDTTSTDIAKPGSTDEETCPKQVISVANTAASASAVPNLAMELDQQATGNGPITDRMGTGSGQSDDENESTTEGTPLPLETDTANSTARSSGLFGDTTSTDIAKPGSTDEETCPKQVISVADTAASASAVPNLAMELDQQATGNGPITDRMGTGSGQSDDENESTTEGTPLPLETDTANSTARSSGLFGDTTSTDIAKPGSTDEETCPKQVISVADTAASASAVPNLAMELDQQATGNGPITDRMGTGSGQADDENESTTEGTPLPLETDTANSTDLPHQIRRYMWPIVRTVCTVFNGANQLYFYME